MVKPKEISAELEAEVSNLPLKVTGKIPSWLKGTMVRNGAVTVSINGKSNEHWFDGLAMLHAFSFDQGHVNYTNKFLRTDAYTTVFEKGSLNYIGFASDPCRSLFKSFFNFFIPHSTLPLHNANVNVAKLADHYVALTEIPLPVKFDPQTLDTLGVLNYQDDLPKEKCWESAHPHHHVNQKQTLNYLIKYGRKSYYTLYSIQDGSSTRSIISEVEVKEPAYMHSFALTENYIILTEFPLVVKPLDLITKGQGFIKNFTWQPKRGTQFIVINRHDGSVKGKYITKPFFAFHHANAFERDGKIHLDCVTYEDATIITDLNIDPSKRTRETALGYIKRFSLSPESGEFTIEPLFSKPCEFPRINQAYDSLPYTYCYVADFSDLNKNAALHKINTETKQVVTWQEEGCIPGEPLFIAAPNSQKEDDGVVLCIIIDEKSHQSFLLILDGNSFQEIGRAHAPHLIPAGLHGQFFA